MILKYIVQLLLVVVGTWCCSSASAKELILQPKKVTTITSPTDARDSRVLIYFELPKELRESQVIIDNAVLIFGSQVTDADLGMIEVCPLVKDWENSGAVSWISMWDSPGGDYSRTIAGRSVSLKSEWGERRISSNVTFVVKAWLDGILENHGLMILPSQEDLASSGVKYSFDVNGARLKIHYGD